MISFNNKIFTAIREFTKKNFEVTSTKRSRLIWAIVSAVLLLIVIIDHKAFTTLQFSSKWILLGVAMIIPFIIGITIAYRINILNDKINKIWHFLIILLMPFPAITMSEALNRVFIYNMMVGEDENSLKSVSKKSMEKTLEIYNSQEEQG